MPGRIAPWRPKLQAVLILVIGLAGFLTGVVGVYLQIQIGIEQRAFHAATACSTPREAAISQRCTYTGEATITGSHREVRIFVDLVFAGLQGPTFTTSFATTREPPAGAIAVGSSQPAQLWDGKVTMVAGIGTADDPDYMQSNIAAAAVFAMFGLVTAIAATFMFRRARRR